MELETFSSFFSFALSKTTVNGTWDIALSQIVIQNFDDRLFSWPKIAGKFKIIKNKNFKQFGKKLVELDTYYIYVTRSQIYDLYKIVRKRTGNQNMLY